MTRTPPPLGPIHKRLCDAVNAHNGRGELVVTLQIWEVIPLCKEVGHNSIPYRESILAGKAALMGARLRVCEIIK